ncbi:MAG: SLBB domain-containing protein [Verrucomicrobiales bacterium]|nr:SLBB domain-containing protein [Verrucomicrobiales bacterium]
MRKSKKSALFLAIALSGFAIAQEKSDPVAGIITNDSEATSVLGGGWPPQNFGKKAGNSTVNEILRGTEQKLTISDPVKESIKKNSTVKPVSEKLLAQNSGPVPKPELTPKPEPSKPKPKPAPIEEIKLPSFATEPKQTQSALLGEKKESTPLILPPLPAVVDAITPAISANTVRKPRPPQPRVKSAYTLGPGDTVSFSTFDRGDLDRTVRIAPDGTVSYLQAVAVNANGLTVDELRDRMESELQKYRRDFKLIVSPQELNSKEFAILGRVRTPGSFPLDRPTTVLEGIALAEGVEVGTIRGSAYGLADFGRSFVARKGRKLDVDFSKLYYEGDLAQNVYLQPNDYLYVASILKNEFYILGAVNNPGRVKMPDRVTVAKAIAMSGGFQNEAYKMKVLVIRGDIHNPTVQVVNVRDVLRGNALDIPVENRDIIFVSRRPFEILERVLDSAITTYMQTVTAEAINIGYTPLIGN